MFTSRFSRYSKLTPQNNAKYENIRRTVCNAKQNKRFYELFILPRKSFTGYSSGTDFANREVMLCRVNGLLVTKLAHSRSPGDVHKIVIWVKLVKHLKHPKSCHLGLQVAHSKDIIKSRCWVNAYFIAALYCVARKLLKTERLFRLNCD